MGARVERRCKGLEESVLRCEWKQSSVLFCSVLFCSVRSFVRLPVRLFARLPVCLLVDLFRLALRGDPMYK